MTPEQERAVAEALGEGLSERETARRTGVSATAAHRARERLGAQEAEQDTPALELTELPERDYGAELAELYQARDALASAVATHEERAEASRTAMRDLEAERTATLASNRDAAPLRPRMRDAADDLDDSEKAAELARGRLAGLDQQIAAVKGRQNLAALRAELADALQVRDEVCAATGDRQRAAVLAVRDAAVDFLGSARSEREAAGHAAELAAAVTARALELGEPVPDVAPAVSTGIIVPPDIPANGGPLALTRALWQARDPSGTATEVAVCLAQAFGWLPPAPPTADEIAERQQQHEQRQADAERLRTGQPAGAAAFPFGGSTTNLDASGRPIPPGYHPGPRDVYFGGGYGYGEPGGGYPVSYRTTER